MAVLPKTMKQIVVPDGNTGIVVREVPVPTPGPGEVLVRIAAAPINPSDIAYLRGSYGAQATFPIKPGFEGSGIVVAAGPGLLPRLWLGKRVACAATTAGAWTEYLVVRAMLCVPLPGSFTLEQGSTMMVNPLSALGIIEIASKKKPAALVITGAASALGRMLNRLAQRSHLPVINIVRREGQVELLQSMGAEVVLNSSSPDYAARVVELIHNMKATVVLDAVGGELGAQLFEILIPGSTIVRYGNLSKEKLMVDPVPLMKNDIRIEGFYLANWVRKRGILETLNDLRKVRRLGATDLRTDVQRRFPFSEVQEAIEIYERDMTGGKVLLVPTVSAQANANDHC